MEKQIETENRESVVHYLPCNIHYDGPAPVESYFHPVSTNNETLTANFRGRKLVGEKVIFPPQIEGSVIEVVHKDNVIIHTTFTEVHIWEHDLKPDSHFLQESFDWLEIADAVSSLS